MTIQNRYKEVLLKTFLEEGNKGNTWMVYPMFEDSLYPGSISFHKTTAEARTFVGDNSDGLYNVMPFGPLQNMLKHKLRLESFGVEKRTSLQFDPGDLTFDFLQANLLQPNHLKTAHLISEAVFIKAIDEFQQGPMVVVYDSGRYLLDIQDLHLFPDETAAKLFTESHAASMDDVRKFKAASITDIYDHFVAAPSFVQTPLISSETEAGQRFISDGLLVAAAEEWNEGRNIFVYNKNLATFYKDDMFFFADAEAAKAFVDKRFANPEYFEIVKVESIYGFFKMLRGDAVSIIALQPERQKIPRDWFHPTDQGFFLQQLDKMMGREGFREHGLLPYIIEAHAAGKMMFVYNETLPKLCKADMQFFTFQDEAFLFVDKNLRDIDDYYPVMTNAVVRLLQQPEFDQTLKAYPTIQSQIKNMTMNEKNYEDLEKKLLYTGFGDTLNEQLKAKIQAGEKEFVLSHQTTYGKDEVVAALQFRKSDTTDMYFFNRYNLLLKNERYPDPIKQTFYINNMQDNITLKEAYNMMSGRAVYKELENSKAEKYNAWVQLDFKQTDNSGNYKLHSFNEGWGFKLEETLAKYPIMALQNEADKKALVESLERGNRQSVTLEADGKQTKAFIEACPQHHGLNFYDQHLNKKLAHELTGKVAAEQKQENKQAVKQRM